ncbi:hypothetical protein N431DRAFT_545198 [Stipitochalara longipes BDJ]|nr:hypothetical protein N431DRAFT_545198 [Stipitochalara longipes BDJ]
MTLSEDSTLQWEPPAGSDKLAIALSYHFPLEKGVEKKMQAATKQFFKQKEMTLTVTVKATENVTESEIDAAQKTISQLTNQASEEADFCRPGDHGEQIDDPGRPEGDDTSVSYIVSTANELKFVYWDPESQRRTQQRTKRAYQEEKTEVTENRGLVCDRHRRQKKKCDPKKCPMNGQNSGQMNDVQLSIPRPQASFCQLPKCTSNYVSNGEGLGHELPALMASTQATTSTLHDGSSAPSMAKPLEAAHGQPETYSSPSGGYNFRTSTTKTMGKMSTASGAKAAGAIGASGGFAVSSNAEQGFHQNDEVGFDSNWFDSSGFFGEEPYLFGTSAMATWYSPPKATWNSECAGTKMQDLNSGTQNLFSTQDDISNAAGGRDWVNNLNGSWGGPSGSSYESLGHRGNGSGEHIKVLSEHAYDPLSLGSSTELLGSNQHSAVHNPCGLTRRIRCVYLDSDIDFGLRVKLTMRPTSFISKVIKSILERLERLGRLGFIHPDNLRVFYDGNRLSATNGETIADLIHLNDRGIIMVCKEQRGGGRGPGGEPLRCLPDHKIPPRTSQRCLRSSTAHLRGGNKPLATSFGHDSRNITVHGINRGPHFCPFAGCVKSRGSGYLHAGHLKTHLRRKHSNLDIDRKSITKTSLKSCKVPLNTTQRCLRSYPAKLRNSNKTVLFSMI